MAREPAPAGKPSSLGRRIALATLLGVLVFAALAFYGDVEALRANLRAFRWEMLALAIALASSNYVLRFARWHYYLGRLGCVVPWRESALVFVSAFVMSVTPGKVGEVWKSWLLKQGFGHSIVKTAPIVVAERLTDLLALVLLTALGALSFERGVPIAIAGGATVAIVLVACAVRSVAELILGVLARLPLVRRAVPSLREAYESLHVMTRPGPIALATGLAVAAWSLEVVALHVVIGGFSGVSLSWEATAFAYSASTIAGALAMMPGGLGVTEAGMTGLLQVLGDGMTPAVATAATMLIRLATLWWAVLVGLLALGVLKGRLKTS